MYSIDAASKTFKYDPETDFVLKLKRDFAQCKDKYDIPKLVNDQGIIDPNGDYKRYFPRPCYSHHCPCPKCRQAWAYREAMILRQSFFAKPANWFCVIKSQTFTDPDKFWSGIKTFLGRAAKKYRTKGHTLEWYLRAEPYDTRLAYHAHLLIRSDLDLDKIKPHLTKILRKAVSNPDVAIHVDDLRSKENSVAYVTKYWYDKDENGRKVYRVPWLPGDQWHNKDVVSMSGKFLTDTKKALWDRVTGKDQQGNERFSWEDYPEWEAPAPENGYIPSPVEKAPWSAEDDAKLDQFLDNWGMG